MVNIYFNFFWSNYFNFFREMILVGWGCEYVLVGMDSPQVQMNFFFWSVVQMKDKQIKLFLKAIKWNGLFIFLFVYRPKSSEPHRIEARETC